MRFFITGLFSTLLLAIATAGATIQAATTSPPILWAKRYSVPRASYTQPVTTAVGPEDSIYVTGWTHDRDHPNDIFTARYSKQGRLLWSTVFDNGTRTVDEPTALAVDAAGNAYVTGISNYGCVTIKYDADGRVVWTSRYEGSPEGGAGGASIALGLDGSVYVGGWAYLDNTRRADALLVKYDPAGNQVWAVTRNGSRSGVDGIGGIAVGKSGAIYVFGSANLNAGEPDIVVARYEPDGTETWYREFDGPVGRWDGVASFALDEADNVILTGGVRGSASIDSADMVTLKYSPEGELLWSAYMDGEAHLADFGASLAVHTDGTSYVGGYVFDSPGEPSLAVLKYAPDGSLLWSARYQFPGSSEIWSYDLALDGDGGVYLTGLIRVQGQADIFTLKYSSAGMLAWVARYGGSSPNGDAGISIALDSERNVVVGGQYAVGSEYQLVMLKYGSLNGVPVADAGADQSIISPAFRADVVLNAAGSQDPEGEALTYRWLEGDTVLGTEPAITASLPQGKHSIILEARDPLGAIGRDLVRIAVLAPPSTKGARVSGSGSLSVPGGVASFSLNVRATNSRASGSFVFTRPDGSRLKATSLSSVTTDGDRAVVLGKLKGPGKLSADFLLTVEDHGEPGAGVDAFRLELSDGTDPFTGLLTDGDLAVQP